MSIVSSELVWRRSQEVSDATTNGGRMSHVSITSGVKNNIFPDVSQAERLAGSTKYRKVFVHVANDDDLQLIAPRMYIETRTPGDDAVYLIPSTQRGTQTTITGTEQKYGAGTLATTVSAGATTIVVDTEDGTIDIFPDNGKIRVSDKTNVSSAGNEEYKFIQSATYNGSQATIVLTTALANGYSNTNTKVALVYEPADVSAEVANFTVTSVAGTYNSSTYPVRGDNIGSIEQDWTITFTSSTAYTISGDTVGAVSGSYNIASDAVPNNPNFSKPYFTIPALAFGGTWATGNTITFKTSPAAIPVWYMRKIPSGANSLSGNSVIVAVEGESA